MTDHLLPPNSTACEQNIALSTARISDVPVPLRSLWNIETCPVEFLPWLAWSLSVDVWSDSWSEQIKRAVIKASYDVHSRKGTLGAVERAVAAVWGDARVLEWFDYNGAPYHFRVELQVEQEGFDMETWGDVANVVAQTKNVRSHLDTIAVYLSSPGELNIAQATTLGDVTTVEPYLVTLLEGEMSAHRAATTQLSDGISVMPRQ